MNSSFISFFFFNLTLVYLVVLIFVTFILVEYSVTNAAVIAHERTSGSSYSECLCLTLTYIFTLLSMTLSVSALTF